MWKDLAFSPLRPGSWPIFVELPGYTIPGGTIHKEYNLNGAQRGANCKDHKRNDPPVIVQGCSPVCA